MALFDGLIDEAEQRFELSGKAETLLAALLGLMTAENGLSGFLNRFRRVGLGELVNSWVSSGANSPLANQQAEDALGADLIGQIANQTGLSTAATIPALAYLIPAMIDSLTPDGVVPNSRNLAAALGSYPGGSAGALPEREITATTGAGANGILRILLPLALVGLFGFLGFQFCSKPNQQITQATSLNANSVGNTNSANVSAANANAATTNHATNGNTNHSDANHGGAH